MEVVPVDKLFTSEDSLYAYKFAIQCIIFTASDFT